MFSLYAHTNYKKVGLCVSCLIGWFIIDEVRQKSMLSIPFPGMPGGGGDDGGRDVDLILDNDTIQPHMGKRGATFPRACERQGR